MQKKVQAFVKLRKYNLTAQNLDLAYLLYNSDGRKVKSNITYTEMCPPKDAKIPLQGRGQLSRSAPWKIGILVLNFDIDPKIKRIPPKK